jgi:peptidyl-prolyl cis-trans isomerase A (cyclophilin A)
VIPRLYDPDRRSAQGAGTGGPGYLIADEFDTSAHATSSAGYSVDGQPRCEHRQSSQFFVTVAATPHLDGKHAVFGQCEPKVPVKISEVKVKSLPPAIDSRPLDDVKIKAVTIERRKK